MDHSSLRDTLLDVIESSLEAQIRAVRRLRSGRKVSPRQGAPEEAGMSQVDMAYNILLDGQAMHITDILAAIKKRFGVGVDRESLVSALSKRIVRGDRFRRAGKNTFALLPGSKP
jgi:hypothetical protein